MPDTERLFVNFCQKNLRVWDILATCFCCPYVSQFRTAWIQHVQTSTKVQLWERPQLPMTPWVDLPEKTAPREGCWYIRQPRRWLRSQRFLPCSTYSCVMLSPRNCCLWSVKNTIENRPLALVKIWNDSPCWHPDFSLMRDSEPESPSYATPSFLTCKSCELTAGCFKRGYILVHNASRILF